MKRKRVLKTKILVFQEVKPKTRKKTELTEKEENTYLERMQIQINRAVFENEVDRNDY